MNVLRPKSADARSIAGTPRRGAQLLTSRGYERRKQTCQDSSKHEKEHNEATKTLPSPTMSMPVGLIQPSHPQEMRVAERLHKLIAREAKQLPKRPPELRASETRSEVMLAEAFTESCLLSLAIWRRFGTAEFAEALGWVQRTDFAAILTLMPSAVEAAVQVWKSGSHAAGERTAAQRHTRSVELTAWDAHTAPGRPVEVSHAAEHAVRRAYGRLLHSIHHPILDLWRKRKAVVEVALTTKAVAAVRDVLMQVRGFCPPDPDAERAGWELAFDLRTLTPLGGDLGPIEWNSDYVVWRRKRICDALPAMSVSQSLAKQCQERRRRRPSTPVHADLTGL